MMTGIWCRQPYLAKVICTISDLSAIIALLAGSLIARLPDGYEQTHRFFAGWRLAKLLDAP